MLALPTMTVLCVDRISVELESEVPTPACTVLRGKGLNPVET